MPARRNDCFIAGRCDDQLPVRPWLRSHDRRIKRALIAQEPVAIGEEIDPRLVERSSPPLHLLAAELKQGGHVKAAATANSWSGAWSEVGLRSWSRTA